MDVAKDVIFHVETLISIVERVGEYLNFFWEYKQSL